MPEKLQGQCLIPYTATKLDLIAVVFDLMLDDEVGTANW